MKWRALVRIWDVYIVEYILEVILKKHKRKRWITLCCHMKDVETLVVGCGWIGTWVDEDVDELLVAVISSKVNGSDALILVFLSSLARLLDFDNFFDALFCFYMNCYPLANIGNWVNSIIPPLSHLVCNTTHPAWLISILTTFRWLIYPFLQQVQRLRPAYIIILAPKSKSWGNQYIKSFIIIVLTSYMDQVETSFVIDQGYIDHYIWHKVLQLVVITASNKIDKSNNECIDVSILSDNLFCGTIGILFWQRRNVLDHFNWTLVNYNDHLRGWNLWASSSLL